MARWVSGYLSLENSATESTNAAESHGAESKIHQQTEIHRMRNVAGALRQLRHEQEIDDIASQHRHQ